MSVNGSVVMLLLFGFSIWSDVTAGEGEEIEWVFQDKSSKRPDLHAEIPDGLLINGINDYDMNTHTTPLLNAVTAGHIDAVKQLIKGGANSNLPDGEGRSALFIACERGFYEPASLLLDAGAEVESRSLDSRTPLYVACQSGYVDVARMLLAAGASVDASVRAGMTPLMIASLKGYSDIVAALLVGGADINRRNDRGECALLLATISPATVAIQIEVGASESNTDPASSTGVNVEPDCLQILIDAGATIDAADVDGKTALIMAAIRGGGGQRHSYLVQRLINANANIDATDTIGYSALTYAMVCDLYMRSIPHYTFFNITIVWYIYFIYLGTRLPRRISIITFCRGRDPGSFWGPNGTCNEN